MEFLLASISDAQEIYNLYRAAVCVGRSRGNSDWDEDYPRLENAREDLGCGRVYVLRDGERIVACVSMVPGDELLPEDLPWTEGAWVEMARLCVSPDCQRRGLSKAILERAFSAEKALGVKCVRYLCAVANPAACSLYRGLGHRELGRTFLYDTDFYCFEHLL